MTPGNGARVSWAISFGCTVAWLLAVVAFGGLGRVAEQWESAVTMLFGSFLAGSSPEGGGAVAFPVFTKALHVPADTARTFGLCIQAVGMSVAALAIVVNRRPIHRRSVIVGSVAGIGGLLLGAALLGDADAVFWPTTFGSGWTKATFSIVLATTSVMMVRQLWTGAASTHELEWARRDDLGVAVAALAGGVLSSLAGTGANILVFLFLVVVVGVAARVALPSVVIVMAAVSIAGFALFGIVDGQLFVEVEGGRVIEVGGTAVDLDQSRTDLLGLWLAAVPVVVWGAPLGSWAAARVREATLVAFVAVLATVEVVTTFVLVDDLRDNAAMLGYLAVSLVAFPSLLLALRRHREAVSADDPAVT